MSSLTYPDQLQLATLALADGRAPHEVGIDTSWTITDHAAALGQGPGCLAAASTRLLTWRAHAHAGVRVNREGLREETTPTRTVLVYGTLPGHVECGEEAFIVSMAENGQVSGRCVAFSRHAWWLARLGAPVARQVQRHVTRRYVEGMRP